MFITIPASAYGSADATSVLDLEPLMSYARQCQPDGICLMPPPGPDDLPNGAALLAMKERLEAEALRVVPGCWEVPPEAPTANAAWQAQSLFEVRALLAALGEADVRPLGVWWRAGGGETRGGGTLEEFLTALLPEAEREGVPLAVQAPLAAREMDALLRRLDSPYLGVCCEVLARMDAPGHISRLGEKLLAVRMAPGAAPDSTEGRRRGWGAAIRALRRMRFSGPVMIDRLETPVRYAHAVGFIRGVLAGSHEGLEELQLNI